MAKQHRPVGQVHQTVSTEQKIHVFAALDNGFAHTGNHPAELGDTLTAYLSLMPVVPFARAFTNTTNIFNDSTPVQSSPDDRTWWLPTPYGAVFTRVPDRVRNPQQYSLHIVSSDAIPSHAPPGCVPFRLQLDRTRDIYCDTRPTAAYFEWIPDSERLVDTGDFRPTDFTMGRFPPPLNRPVAALLNVTLLNPLVFPPDKV